jgi:flagellar biosynthesis protein FliP
VLVRTMLLLFAQILALLASAAWAAVVLAVFGAALDTAISDPQSSDVVPLFEIFVVSYPAVDACHNLAITSALHYFVHSACRL